jgi:hypothetical protein
MGRTTIDHHEFSFSPFQIERLVFENMVDDNVLMDSHIKIDQTVKRAHYEGRKFHA